MSIPGLPGVPPLKTTLQRNLISTGVVALIDSFVTGVQQRWEIDDSKGKIAIQPDSFLGITYRETSRLLDYPIEKGSFSTYNKVALPYDNIVSMAKGGSQSERIQFLQKLDSMAADLNLYTIVTPNKTYTNANIERYSMEQQVDHGANLVIVHVHFREIRTTASIRYTQTRSGASIITGVPTAQRTQKITSTGIASPTSTTSPASRGVINNGSVSTSTSSVSTGTIQ